MVKLLIIYYFLDGKIKKVVDVLEKLINVDVYEIELEKFYIKLIVYIIGLGYCKIGYEFLIKNEIDLFIYDKIFIGGLIWWFIYVFFINFFINKYDLSDKIIYFFGIVISNFGVYFERFNKGCKVKEIKKLLKILRFIFKNGLEEVVKLWLNEEYN